MPSKKDPATVDDEHEPIMPYIPMFGFIPELKALIVSEIVTFDNGSVTWRDGHLEHLARQYASNPVQTERDYHDDVTVARVYSADEFNALVAAASGAGANE